MVRPHSSYWPAPQVLIPGSATGHATSPIWARPNSCPTICAAYYLFLSVSAAKPPLSPSTLPASGCRGVAQGASEPRRRSPMSWPLWVSLLCCLDLSVFGATSNRASAAPTFSRRVPRTGPRRRADRHGHKLPTRSRRRCCSWRAVVNFRFRFLFFLLYNFSIIFG
jgi:hypothetical protein